MKTENKERRYFFINSIAIAHPPDYIDNVGTVFSASLYSEAVIVQSPDEIPGFAPYIHPDVVQQFAAELSLGFVPQKGTGANVCFINSEEVRPEFRTSFSAIDLLDYIYAVLHSAAYREQYVECLKIDFPRVSYPKDTTTFWRLVVIGSKLRSIHLFASPVINKYIAQYRNDGNNYVTDIKYEDDKVNINDTQYFANISVTTWQFCIAGYQPAQKWLEGRQGHELSPGEILQYQKKIIAIAATVKLMKEIDRIVIE